MSPLSHWKWCDGEGGYREVEGEEKGEVLSFLGGQGRGVCSSGGPSWILHCNVALL